MNKDNKEIERRFLLRKLPPKKFLKRKAERRLYKTVYLLTGNPELRIRKTETYNGQERGQASFSMTVKFGEGLERDEFINETSCSFFEEHSLNEKGTKLEKVRYRIKENDLLWELDDINHLGKRFFLAEVEIKKTFQKVVFPKWLSKLVVKEVTNDIRYFNKNIAQYGCPERD